MSANTKFMQYSLWMNPGMLRCWQSEKFPLLPEVQTHITSISKVLEPFSPGASGLLHQSVLSDREVVSEAGSLWEEREAHNIGHGSEGAADLDLFRCQVLLNVEVLHTVKKSMNGGLLLTWSDSHLLVAVSTVIDLNDLPDKSTARVSGVNTSIEGIVSLIVI